MPDKLSNISSSIVYSAIGAEPLRIVEQLTTLDHSPQGVSIRKISSCILKFFDKHQVDFNNICQSKQELLNLVS